MKVIYLIGSLRNPEIPKIGNVLRRQGYEAFDDWHAAGPIADDSWQIYETTRGRGFKEALKGFAAQHVFAFDRYHLDRCDAGLLVLPAGKSCHLELGYLRGQQKPVYALYLEPPKDGRWDVMMAFCNEVFFSEEEMLQGLKL